MSECIIEFKNVTLKEDDAVIVENFNLQLCEGDKLLVWPPNKGANSFVKLISGDIEPDEGEVIINGTVRNVSDKKEDLIWNWKEYPECFLAIEEHSFKKEKDEKKFRELFEEAMAESKVAAISTFKKSKHVMCNKFLNLELETKTVEDVFDNRV